MDIALQMKSIDMIIKFLKHDLKNLMPYGPVLPKKTEGTVPSVPLPRTSPEEQGVPSKSVQAPLFLGTER